MTGETGRVLKYLELGVFTSLDEPQDVVISENINLPG